MAVITYTAQKLTEPNIVREFSVTTESQKDPTDSTGQRDQYRAICRLVVERDTFDLSSFSQPTDSLVGRASIPCRFNETEEIEIFPIAQSDGTQKSFKLIGQHFVPKNERGSKFFTAVQEYVSVSDWRTLEW